MEGGIACNFLRCFLRENKVLKKVLLCTTVASLTPYHLSCIINYINWQQGKATLLLKGDGLLGLWTRASDEIRGNLAHLPIPTPWESRELLPYVVSQRLEPCSGQV
ncbi:hypothetical protein KIL84_016554 [Mauremys mutica]|uniref:Uncharacterized protein n=1 Tax=Mauremys mutica TaxID=74926 RepID=A0A9D3X543_9SAUR|nr:hypothetical protein KIL84_016554 [Mauremys mutica]